MGMTYWIHTLVGREISKESDDHSIMHELSEELDAECESLGIPKLSSFVDYTDLEYNVSEDEEDVEIDEETGYGYGIDDMEWFDIASGLSCLERVMNLAQVVDLIGNFRPRVAR